MSLTIGKLVITMVDTIMFFVSQVNQTTVTAPGIRMNNALRLHLAADDGLQGLSGAVRNDLGINLAATLKDAEDRGFIIRAAATFSFYTPDPEVCMIRQLLFLQKREMTAHRIRQYFF